MAQCAAYTGFCNDPHGSASSSERVTRQTLGKQIRWNRELLDPGHCMVPGFQKQWQAELCMRAEWVQAVAWAAGWRGNLI